jgi:hypothetical protein
VISDKSRTGSIGCPFMRLGLWSLLCDRHGGSF